MSSVIKNPQARSDLKQIWHYIADDNRQRANVFLCTLDDKMKSLAQSPFVGRKRDELMPNLRSFPVGHYVIFYLPNRDGIEVVRVLHGARDIDTLFSETDEETMH